MTRAALFAAMLTGAAALALGWGIAGRIPPAVGAALLGLAWMAAYARRRAWGSNLALAGFVLFSMIGVWLGISPWLAFVSVAASLAAWDLIAFRPRLDLAGGPSEARRMERAHLLRLGLVIGFAALGYAAVDLFSVHLTFGGAAILALLVVWGVSALVYNLRGRE
jgi:hypothetical protein